MSLEGRASRYAALADPMRLRIVDLLTVGDASPTELQGRLLISSSLLAHHLGILEREAIIVRERSEADRRRTYVRLNDTAFDDLIPAPQLAARRVVFVCTGNSARSQLAAALWQDASDIPSTSAGTHPADRIEPGAIATAQRHGLHLGANRPCALVDVLEADDFVITVCDSAHEELVEPGQLHWSIPDPVRDGSDAAFDAAFDEIAARIEKLAPRVTPTSRAEDAGFALS
ncbi:ArsR family transcriptional regulator [Microbacterium rhizosphaerae]